MDETRPHTGAEERLEHEAQELDERLGQLGEHLDHAKDLAAQRRREADPTTDVAGDWRDTRPDRPNGDDPEGAIDG